MELYVMDNNVYGLYHGIFRILTRLLKAYTIIIYKNNNQICIQYVKRSILRDLKIHLQYQNEEKNKRKIKHHMNIVFHTHRPLKKNVDITYGI